MIVRTKTKILYVLFFIAVWPSLFHIYSLVSLNVPVKSRSFIDYFMASPTILVFDRPAYFGQMKAKLTYSDSTSEWIDLDNVFFSKISPYPLGAYVTRSLARVWKNAEALEVLDLVFCQQRIPALGLKNNITEVEYSLTYLPDSKTFGPVKVTCQK